VNLNTHKREEQFHFLERSYILFFLENESIEDYPCLVKAKPLSESCEILQNIHHILKSNSSVTAEIRRLIVCIDLLTRKHLNNKYRINQIRITGISVAVAVCITLVGIWVGRAIVYTIGNAVFICIGISDPTSADPGFQFQEILRTLINAIRGAIPIRILIRHTALADPRRQFQRVVGALIAAVRGAIPIRIPIRHPAPADPGRKLQRVAGALIVAVRRSVSIRILIGHPAPADPGRKLQRVAGALITSIPIAVTVKIYLL
jgi:hypothetical protein